MIIFRCKMATETDVSRVSSVKISSFAGILDPRVERILWHLEDDTRKNVIEELAFDVCSDHKEQGLPRWRRPAGRALK